MSHNRHNNYNNYRNYNPPVNNKPEDDVANNDPVVDEPTIGVVNCKALNVRSEANVESAIICVINKGDEVVIGETEGDFFEVHSKEDVKPGFHGYCMMKFISIK